MAQESKDKQREVDEDEAPDGEGSSETMRAADDEALVKTGGSDEGEESAGQDEGHDEGGEGDAGAEEGEEGEEGHGAAQLGIRSLRARRLLRVGHAGRVRARPRDPVAVELGR